MNYVLMGLAGLIFLWIVSVGEGIKNIAHELRAIRRLYTKSLGIGEDPKP